MAAAVRQPLAVLFGKHGQREGFRLLHELVRVTASPHEDLGKRFSPDHPQAAPGNRHGVELFSGEIPRGKEHPSGIEGMEQGKGEPGDGNLRSAHAVFYQIAAGLAQRGGITYDLRPAHALRTA